MTDYHERGPSPHEEPSTDSGRVDTGGAIRWLAEQPSSDRGVELSIVVPAFNEERRIATTLIDMIDYCDKRFGSYEIIVVDDGSRDRTIEVVRKFERIRSGVQLIRLAANMGKGYAVKTGVLSAHGRLVLMADADGATPIVELERLMPEIDRGVPIVIGSRAVASEETSVTTSWHRKFLGQGFNRLVNTVLLPGIRDTQCGFKLFVREVAEPLFAAQTATRFSFDVEILYIAQRAAIPIAEIPINWRNVPGSKVNLVLDALDMLRDVLRFRYLHRGVSPEWYAERRQSS